MRVVYFTQSLVSDWNHGNAHFLRGVVTELLARGHRVDTWEPRTSWSRANLVHDHGERPLARFRQAFPQLRPGLYDYETVEPEELVDGADLVLVHEWNEQWLISRLGRLRAAGEPFRLLFHDTHHRAVTAPDELAELPGFDGVLAYGEVLARLYRRRGLRAWTWHEAADTRVFFPREAERRGDVVWVGNWGDGERTAELHRFLLRPVRRLRLRGEAYGVRYPHDAAEAVRRAGLRYLGWIANHEVPEAFAAHGVTLHVPRRPYRESLPGIPTIRPFEALACGIPLVCAPWDDVEGLFTPGEDYLVARDEQEMARHLRTALHEPSTVQHGLATIRARHTCTHRVDELLAICDELGVAALEAA